MPWWAHEARHRVNRSSRTARDHAACHTTLSPVHTPPSRSAAEPFTFSESEETTIDALTVIRRRLQELTTGGGTTSQTLDALTQLGRRAYDEHGAAGANISAPCSPTSATCR